LERMNNTGIIILAAGKSSRFGSIKQLLNFQGKTLVQHVIDEATKAEPDTIVIVTGASAKEVSASVADRKVTTVFNENWSQGMASGIVAGVQKLMASDSNLEKIIIAVCDQPFVSSALFENLDQEQNKSGKHIVASKYADTIGTPVLFTRKYFDQLLSLKGDTGAKKILETNKEDVATVDFAKGHIDIDTKKDLDNLLDEQKHIL
jgi:CTP:molybdopterin cytidylyltransferase MocA